jgi:hypothetical protein
MAAPLSGSPNAMASSKARSMRAPGARISVS